MKKSILSAIVLSALLAVTTSRVSAHPEGHAAEPPKKAAAPAAADDHGHEHTTKVPATVADILKEIEKQQTRLEKIVADKKLPDAHDHAFAIRDLAKSLVAKVPAAKKADVEQAAKKITEVAAAIDKSSAAGAQKTTESNAAAMGRAIKTLKTIVSHDH